MVCRLCRFVRKKSEIPSVSHKSCYILKPHFNKTFDKTTDCESWKYMSLMRKKVLSDNTMTTPTQPAKSPHTTHYRQIPKWVMDAKVFTYICWLINTTVRITQRGVLTSHSCNNVMYDIWRHMLVPESVSVQINNILNIQLLQSDPEFSWSTFGTILQNSNVFMTKSSWYTISAAKLKCTNLKLNKHEIYMVLYSWIKVETYRRQKCGWWNSRSFTQV